MIRRARHRTVTQYGAKHAARWALPVMLGALVALAAPTPTPAQDIREAARRATADREAAGREAAAAEASLLNDRRELTAKVAQLQQQHDAAERQLKDLAARQAAGERELAALSEQWSARDLDFREISGNVRVAARDLESLLRASPLSADAAWRLEAVQPLLDAGYFPDIDDISAMAAVYFDECERGGQVSLREGTFVGRDGREQTGQVFQLGRFTTVYRNADETGFLAWNPESARLFAQSELPPRAVASALNRYLDGKSDDVPVDLSGGAALRQYGRRTNLREHLTAGGPVMVPILLIALAALGIVIYKVVFFRRLHGDTTRIMHEVHEHAGRGDWDACGRTVSGPEARSWPVAKVISAGLEARDESRETLESVLQEAILHELPRVQRGVALLAVLGAVAPLLGLLGTVTGMIETFRTITMFGTSDPRLMSGGISEALITTEVGLVVAIPIMLVHSWLSRRSDDLIGEMEEKAMQLTNLLHNREQRGAAT